MRRVLSTVVLFACVLLVSACSGDNPPSPLPITPAPSGSTQLSAQIYVLRPDQLRDYNRAANATVSATTIAIQEGDATLQQKVEAQGLLSGVRATFQPPQTPTVPTAFNQIISEGLIFRDVAGAGQFFSDELARRSMTAQGQTLAPLTGLPQTGVDDLRALQVTLAPQTTSGAPPKAYLALMRKGRVVSELLGGGTAGSATVDAFSALLTLMEQALASPPNI